MELFGYGLIQEKSTRTKRISMKMYRAPIRMLAITDIGSMIPRPGTKQQLPQPHHCAPGSDGSLFDLVRLQVADQVPGGVSDQLHLWQRFLDSILAEDGQPGLHRLPASVPTKALGDGDDGDLVGVAARAGDALAHRLQILGDAHLIATMAPKRAPSGVRRCEGRKGVSFVHSASWKICWTPSSSSCACRAAARSSRKRSPFGELANRASSRVATSSPTQ